MAEILLWIGDWLANTYYFLLAPPASLVATLVAGWLGLMIGSFLNVVIHRLPIMMQRDFDNYCAEERGEALPHTDHYSLAVPRSACPHCGHKITALENIPLFSYFILLRGKCSNCKAPISLRYPLIEALSGILSACVIWHFGSGFAGWAALLFIWLCIAMTWIDLDTRLLPDDLTYSLLWLGLLMNTVGTFAPLKDAVTGAAVGYLLLWGVNWLFKLVRKIDGMGGGDFILLSALAGWFGWMMLPVILLMSSIVAIMFAVYGMLFLGRDSQFKIPFGPYLTGAGLIVLFFGKQLLAMLVPGVVA
jgi:leader peptidase (prepilin peptidase)/N-methyltransferase